MTVKAPIRLGPEEFQVEVLSRTLRVHTREDAETLQRVVEVLETSFRDMERAYGLRWGNPPSVLDTSSWVLMGALNMAHRLVRQEQIANQHTQDLEQKLTKLLDDVPDEILTPMDFEVGVR